MQLRTSKICHKDRTRPSLSHIKEGFHVDGSYTKVLGFNIRFRVLFTSNDERDLNPAPMKLQLITYHAWWGKTNEPCFPGGASDASLVR